jgi:WD40 repeat protein
VRLWHVATGQELAVLTGHHGPVNCVAFAPDGRTLASGGSVSLTLASGASAGTIGEVFLWDALSVARPAEPRLHGRD